MWLMSENRKSFFFFFFQTFLLCGQSLRDLIFLLGMVPKVLEGQEKINFLQKKEHLLLPKKKNMAVMVSGFAILQLYKNNFHHLSLTIVHTLSKYTLYIFFPILDHVFVSLSHTHTYTTNAPLFPLQWGTFILIMLGPGDRRLQ